VWKLRSSGESSANRARWHDKGMAGRELLESDGFVPRTVHTVVSPRVEYAFTPL
jgi:hypothetical protein